MGYFDRVATDHMSQRKTQNAKYKIYCARHLWRHAYGTRHLATTHVA
jgi:hypothetical protein